jgi:hypothetical protein
MPTSKSACGRLEILPVSAAVDPHHKIPTSKTACRRLEIVPTSAAIDLRVKCRQPSHRVAFPSGFGVGSCSGVGWPHQGCVGGRRRPVCAFTCQPHGSLPLGPPIASGGLLGILRCRHNGRCLRREHWGEWLKKRVCVSKIRAMKSADDQSGTHHERTHYAICFLNPYGSAC